MIRADIPTPALLVDVAALERNITSMARFFSARTARLRPHFKAHKTPEIARRQLAAGSCVGLTCATVSEAEIAATLCHDLLIANEVIGEARCARVAALAADCAVMIAVDSHEGLMQMSRAAGAAGVSVGVLVDVNVGQDRCGVAPRDEALALAREIAIAPGLRLCGVMGYEGHLQPLADYDERERRTLEAMEALVETADLIREMGLTCDVVSAGGTGTFDISGKVPGVTEIQAGSYALMDTDYARVGVPFEHALSLLGTVVSRPVPTRCVINAGHKATTKDHGLPAVKDVPHATVVALNDEHAVITVPADAPISIGDRIELLPSHVDPTMNLHDVVYAMNGERVAGVWPITARGYPIHRPE
jgi:D-serine deaminase-like pyridoxal phosphate-dependent protein